MQHEMRLAIAYSKIKQRNLVLINNATYQRETLLERPIRQLLNHQNLRIILVKIGCFTHNGDLSNTHTPTHPPLRTYTNSSLASCILVQLSDLCNLGFAVHVQYGITNTCWRHARYWGVCRGASHVPNSLIYKKVPQIAVCEQSKSEKLGILCIFGQRNSLKFRKWSSFVRFAPSEVKKLQNFRKKAHIQKIRKRSTFENFAPSSEKNPWYGLGWSQSNA